VRIAFTLSDAEAEVIEQQEVAFVFGYGQILPAIERALEGAQPGDRRALRLAPEEAFGPRRLDAVIHVDRADFPQEVEAGDRFEAENEQGRTVVLTVLDVGNETLELDTNHPLAGQVVGVELKVLDVRPANAQELAEAARDLERRDQADAATLVPLEHLLRKRTQR
jgi:FKBP-type peptidyl-prolyl cis-trans isomerase SlyD